MRQKSFVNQKSSASRKGSSYNIHNLSYDYGDLTKKERDKEDK